MTDNDREGLNGGLAEAFGRIVNGDDWERERDLQRRLLRRTQRRERIVSTVGAVLGFTFVACIVAVAAALVVLLWRAVL